MENYKKIRKIGRGTYGDVLLVERIKDNQLLALKKVVLENLQSSSSSGRESRTSLKPAEDLQTQQKKDKKFSFDYLKEKSLGSSSDDTQVALNNEIKILQTLDHPYIIKYHESFVYKKHSLCIITEFAENGDLQKQIKDAKKGKTYSHQQIFNWFCELALAIGHIHSKNILHRDLKPKNILLTKDNEAKIADFGISKMLDNTFDMAKTATGTPYYLSPEVCLGQKYDNKSDMWMLGCILYELCTLRRPFEGDSLNQVLHKITKESYQKLDNGFEPIYHKLIDVLLQKQASLRASITEILLMPEVRQNINIYCNKQQKIQNIKYIKPISQKKHADSAKINNFLEIADDKEITFGDKKVLQSYNDMKISSKHLQNSNKRPKSSLKGDHRAFHSKTPVIDRQMPYTDKVGLKKKANLSKQSLHDQEKKQRIQELLMNAKNLTSPHQSILKSNQNLPEFKFYENQPVTPNQKIAINESMSTPNQECSLFQQRVSGISLASDENQEVEDMNSEQIGKRKTINSLSAQQRAADNPFKGQKKKTQSNDEQVLESYTTIEKSQIHNLTSQNRKIIGPMKISQPEIEVPLNRRKLNYMKPQPPENIRSSDVRSSVLKKPIQINTNLEPSQSKKQYEMALAQAKYLREQQNNRVIKQSSISCGSITVNFSQQSDQLKELQKKEAIKKNSETTSKESAISPGSFYTPNSFYYQQAFVKQSNNVISCKSGKITIKDQNLSNQKMPQHPNTQTNMYVKKQLSSEVSAPKQEQAAKTPQDSFKQQPNNQQSKYFTFDGNSIFNPKNPVSPARGHLATEFVKQKIGSERYEQVLKLLQESDDPLKLLNISKEYNSSSDELDPDQKQILTLINDDRNFLSIFKYIVNCSLCSPSQSIISGGKSAKSGQNSSQDQIQMLIAQQHTPNSIYTPNSIGVKQSINNINYNNIGQPFIGISPMNGEMHFTPSTQYTNSEHHAQANNKNELELKKNSTESGIRQSKGLFKSRDVSIDKYKIQMGGIKVNPVQIDNDVSPYSELSPQPNFASFDLNK